jgi:outer membrane receptor for ferrienterochelin and colicins
MKTKMDKVFPSIMFLLAIIYTCNAQKVKTDANITGDVQCDGEHVPFISVTVDGTTIGTAADATGHFQLINLPLGELTIRVSGIGFKSASQRVKTEANKTVDIKFIIEKDVLNVEGVVVTANRNQSNRAKAPVMVTTVSPQSFINTQSLNIAEGLSFTTGLRTETDCQNCGFTQLRMNGMEGSYTQILINSRPVFSGVASVYGLELIPVNMVERMEIVRGGGSALYGGNAIAGTVNIITKEPVRNSFNFDSRLGTIGLRSSNTGHPAIDGYMSFNASTISDDRKTGGYIYSTLRERSSYDANNDDFSEMVEIENTTFGFNIFHKPGTKSKISLDGYRIDEYRRGGNKFDYLPHEADIAEQVEHLITGGNLSYDLFTSDSYDKLSLYASTQLVKRSSYYGVQQDPNAYGKTKNLTSSIGAQYAINTSMFLFAPASTIFGVDNTTDYLIDKKLGANGDNNTTLVRQHVNTLGYFAQHDWKSEHINISLGLRYDQYRIKDKESDNADISQGVIIPRVSIMYKITPDLRLRAGYAKGYRGSQIFNEDLHIELVNATRVQTINSENLKQETSHSFTSSINSMFNTGKIINEVVAEGFYTLLKDPFSNIFYPIDDAGNFAYKRVNAADGAYVTGINLEWNSLVSAHLETQTGLTFQVNRYQSMQAWGEDESSVSRNFMRTPNHYGFATLIWKPTHHFNTVFSLNYTGKMYVPHFGLNPDDYPDGEKQMVLEAIGRRDIIAGEQLKKSGNYLIPDILLSYDVHFSNEIEIQFYAGLKNIFNTFQNDHDKGVYRDSGYIYGPAQPRTLNFGVRFGNIP